MLEFDCILLALRYFQFAWDICCRNKKKKKKVQCNTQLQMRARMCVYENATLENQREKICLPVLAIHPDFHFPHKLLSNYPADRRDISQYPIQCRARTRIVVSVSNWPVGETYEIGDAHEKIIHINRVPALYVSQLETC